MMKISIIFLFTLLIGGCSQNISPEQNGSDDPVERENAIAMNNVWHKAKLRGVAFRAIGQEPAWLLEMTTGSEIVVKTNYGQTQKTYQYVQPNVDQTARTSDFVLDDLTIQIQGKPCSDVMSGESFESTVELQYNDHTLKGCGRALY